jgi:hypothetical protein
MVRLNLDISQIENISVEGAEEYIVTPPVAPVGDCFAGIFIGTLKVGENLGVNDQRVGGDLNREHDCLLLPKVGPTLGWLKDIFLVGVNF